MNLLDGKVAIVTGAAMGMGAATAELFAQNGAKVVIADFNEELGKKQTEKIMTAGGTASFINVDVSDPTAVERMVQFTVDTYGKLDCAVNNAARTPDDKPLAEMSKKVMDGVLAVDLKGVALCLKYEIMQMLKQGTGGSIINISSVSGIRPQPGTPIYIAAKFGVIGLTKSASMDYSDKGIRVNSVAPGAVKTPMLMDALEHFGFDPEAYAKQLSMLGRFAEASEIAEASMWLASDESSYITGAVLAVEGGYTSM
ncbi:MAG: SDR family NAD(P)-dependent oxidoreductase [Dehalobacterium sp.]|jgi:NAD(P)-dependent dehydrogenase (short-subunit alcohol dehydrogenase family)